MCIKHLLIHYITVEKLFPLRRLNQHILEFSFGPTECKNRPSDIATHHLTPNGELRQSGQFVWHNDCGYGKEVYYAACQMGCLGHFLPLIIGDLVPYKDPHWDNYIMLLDIVDEVFAHVTTS